MGKNDWTSGTTLTRSNVNRPFWVASGIYNSGDSQIELNITPGRIRFPYKASVLYSGQAQRFVIKVDGSTDANKYLNLFVRSDGTFMVSGSTSQSVPGPPRYDAEYIAQVYTGVTISTANMKGPWNAASFENWEQRGELVGTTRPRAIYNRKIVSGNIQYNSHNSAATASGLSYLTFDDPGADDPQLTGLRTLLYAQIRWVPSGALTSGDLYVTPVFGITSPTNSPTNIVTNQRTHRYTVAQNPDAAVPARGGVIQETTTLLGLNYTANNSELGYSLQVYIDDSAHLTDTAKNPMLRIQEITFFAIPGFYSSSINEPS